MEMVPEGANWAGICTQKVMPAAMTSEGEVACRHRSVLLMVRVQPSGTEATKGTRREPRVLLTRAGFVLVIRRATPIAKPGYSDAGFVAEEGRPRLFCQDYFPTTTLTIRGCGDG